MSMMNDTTATANSSSSSSGSVPLVQVPGLRFGEHGNAELIFAYDSDWSDLGDDEDPDSNDERYVA